MRFVATPYEPIDIVRRVVRWFQETGIEENGFKSLEQALYHIFEDQGYTLQLYLDALATLEDVEEQEGKKATPAVSRSVSTGKDKKTRSPKKPVKRAPMRSKSKPKQPK